MPLTFETIYKLALVHLCGVLCGGERSSQDSEFFFSQVGNGNMVPLNNPMIPMAGGPSMGGQGPMGSSPLASMSMLPSQQNPGRAL